MIIVCTKMLRTLNMYILRTFEVYGSTVVIINSSDTSYFNYLYKDINLCLNKIAMKKRTLAMMMYNN